MSGPDRIFTKSWKHATHSEVGVWSATHHVGTVEYVRRDPKSLTALPEVQALIAGAFEAARLAAFHALHGRPVYTSPLIAVTTAIRAMTPADAIVARDAAIAEAAAKEREACARMVDCGCDKRRKAAVIEAKTSAERARACGQYNCGAEDADAIRKRGEG